jgi:peptide chain release factor 1
LDWKFTRGTGPGGQHRNKVDTCVYLTHIPTGTKVKVDGRSRSTNEETALIVLRNRLKAEAKSKFFQKRSKIRKEQVGSGMRGDKIRTIRVRDDIVTDHMLDIKISYKKYSRGDLSQLR